MRIIPNGNKSVRYTCVRLYIRKYLGEVIKINYTCININKIMNIKYKVRSVSIHSM